MITSVYVITFTAYFVYSVLFKEVLKNLMLSGVTKIDVLTERGSSNEELFEYANRFNHSDCSVTVLDSSNSSNAINIKPYYDACVSCDDSRCSSISNWCRANNIKHII